MPGDYKATSLDEATIASALEDGAIYRFPTGGISTRTTFSVLTTLNALVVKVPTPEPLDDFARAMVGETSPKLVRPAYDEERDIASLLNRYPAFRACHRQHAAHCHYLLVHKLQHDRLLAVAPKIQGFCVPRTVFALLARPRLFRSDELLPAALQEKLAGTNLLDMYDTAEDVIKPQWRQYLPQIHAILEPLLRSQLRHELNWFIKNFIFNPQYGTLGYVDIKPTFAFDEEPNERNVQGLRRLFL